MFCIRNHTNKQLALEVVIDMATVSKGVPEEFNKFLRTLHYRPASILHRVDALSYVLQFVRSVLELYIIYNVFSPTL